MWKGERVGSVLLRRNLTAWYLRSVCVAVSCVGRSIANSKVTLYTQALWLPYVMETCCPSSCRPLILLRPRRLSLSFSPSFLNAPLLSREQRLSNRVKRKIKVSSAVDLVTRWKVAMKEATATRRKQNSFDRDLHVALYSPTSLGCFRWSLNSVFQNV